jgi:hypothetical protein
MAQNDEKKISLHVLIEGGRTFSNEFVQKQKIQVVTNKTLEHFSLSDGDKRTLTRADGSSITDLQLTIEQLNLRDNETLRFLLNAAPKPEEPKKFA